MFRFGPTRDGRNPANAAIGIGNVGTLRQRWTGQTASSPAGRAAVLSSPAVVGGKVYVGSNNGRLLVFDSAGGLGCSGTPRRCNPLWSGITSGAIQSSPAVVGGRVFVGSNDKSVYAFDAAGITGCGGTPRICNPLWRVATSGAVASSPVVTGGVVYVATDGGFLLALSTDGRVLWRGSVTLASQSSPVVANGLVYVGSNDGRLYAFDAAGVAGCSGSPRRCTPRWTAPTGESITSAPMFSGGRIYLGTHNGVWAYDAAGKLGCGGTPKQCYPLWTTRIEGNLAGVVSSPAVADTTVVIASQNGALYAYDLAGKRSCGGVPVICDPLWRAYVPQPISSSPAVSNGVVYIGSGNGYLYAFSAAGTTSCGGSPRTCSPLLGERANNWTSAYCPAGNASIYSSPAVAGRRVFIGSGDCELHAFALP